MSCTCNSPIRPEFKNSYKDLLDKPRINGTIIDGDVETDNLGIKYPNLAGKPSINGVTLDGNLTPADLGIKAGAQFKIVQQLPITGIDEATIYLVPVQVGQTDNIYQEWIFINNKWEKIGDPISIEVPKPRVTTKQINITADVEHTNFVINSIDDLKRLSGEDIEDNTIYTCRAIGNSWGDDAPVFLVDTLNAGGSVTLTFPSQPQAYPSLKQSFNLNGYTFYVLVGDLIVWGGKVYVHGDFVEVVF